MQRIRLVCWSESEAPSRIAALEEAGWEVDFEPLRDREALERLRRETPAGIVVDLSRSPARGRDLALWLRQQRTTRRVPLVLLGGSAEKVEPIQALLPDAAYAGWEGFASVLERAIRNPPAEPVVPASVFAGYAGTPLPKKLGIQAGFTVALVQAPPDFEITLGSLPEGVTLRGSNHGHRDLTICFVRCRRQLRRRIDSLVRVSEQGHVWIAWPKKTSSLESDLSQAEVRRTGLDAGLVDFKICAIDDTWSGLCFARRRR